jgi:hypothetical protein
LAVPTAATVHNRATLGIACALASSFLCDALAASTPATSETQPELAAVLLEQKTDADSLAAAAVLRWPDEQEEALTLTERATSIAPTRADLAWLRAQLCRKLNGCDPTLLDRRVLAIDPANGAPWLSAVYRADQSQNAADRSAALAAIGHSQRVDIYWEPLIGHLSQAIAQTDAVSLRDAQVTVIGYLAAQAVPAYGTVDRACRGDELQHAEVIETCRDIAKAFMNGDSYLTQMVGISIAKRVWAENSPQWKAAAEQRRTYDYRAQFAQDLDAWTAAHPQEYLTLCLQKRREQDVYEAWMILAGRNPEPPSGWQKPESKPSTPQN